MRHGEPIVLSSGDGTQLWSRSRAFYPKRLPEQSGFEGSTKACNIDHRFLFRNELDTLSIAETAVSLAHIMGSTASPRSIDEYSGGIRAVMLS